MTPDQQLKRLLARELVAIIDGYRDHSELDQLLEVHPTRISHLRHGKLARFSIATLLRMLARTGHEIEVAIRERKPPVRVRPPPAPWVTVVRQDRFGRLIESAERAR